MKDGEIIGVIEDQQPARIGGQPLSNGKHNQHLIGLILLGKVEVLGDGYKIYDQGFTMLGANPEHIGILLSIAVGIFQSKLRFTDPAKAINGLDLGKGCGLALLQVPVQLLDEILSTQKEWIAPERHHPDLIRRRLLWLLLIEMLGNLVAFPNDQPLGVATYVNSIFSSIIHTAHQGIPAFPLFFFRRLPTR